MTAAAHHHSELESAGVWKTWTLICVAEASRMGISPMNADQLHVVLYLANTLADLYGVTRVRGRVLKKGPLPFYPDVQWEIDRLAYCDVLTIERVDFHSKNRVTAHYGMGGKGRKIYQALICSGPEAQRTAQLFRELVSACFSRFLIETPAIGPIDANYGDSGQVDGEVVDFAEWADENRNMELANYLIGQLRELRPNARRDGVRLYCDYLDRALAIHG